MLLPRMFSLYVLVYCWSSLLAVYTLLGFTEIVLGLIYGELLMICKDWVESRDLLFEVQSSLARPFRSTAVTIDLIGLKMRADGLSTG